MKQLHFSRRVLALTVVATAALLTACGGGDTSLTPAQSFAARIATEAPVAGSLPAPVAGSPPATNSAAKRNSAAPVAITNDQFFQWLQLMFPEVLGVSPPNLIPNLTHEGKPFDVREFSGGTYIGIYEGRVYALGPFTNGQLVDLGVAQDYSAQVCSRIDCGGAGNTGGGNGALNGCTVPASEGLRIGNRYSAVYTGNVFVPQASSGEFTTEGTVVGGATFEGQTAIKVSNRVFGMQSGQPVDATVVAYEQVAENELTRSLGSEADISMQGFSATTRTVNTPAYLNDEFTLQPGQSIDQTHTSTTTIISSSFQLPPSTNSSTMRVTYEARETITVLGRGFDTCRYKTTTAGEDTVSYVWYIVGKGIPARQESRNTAGTVLGRNELKSATINGAGI